MILPVAFGALLFISFAVAALLLNGTKSQQMIERRIHAVTVLGSQTGSGEPVGNQLLKLDPAHKLRWLNSLLHSYQMSRRLRIRIIQADVKTTPAMILLTSSILAIISFIAMSLLINIIILQIGVALLAGYLPIGLLSFKRAGRIRAFNNALPEAIDMMARALRAGHSMTASINIIAEQSVEPVRSEFNEVFKQQNFGLPLRDAMQQMLDRVPSQDLRVVITGILVQKETGGNLAEILDRTAHTIRERLKIFGEIRTHTAQGRMTGYILCTLPIVMLGIINLINPGYSKVLLDTPTGKTLSYIGIFLLSSGGLIIRQIINGIEV